MALEIRSIPVLTGETAERFVREAEENERNPQRRKLVFSFEDIDRIMERSRKYMKEHGGKGPLQIVVEAFHILLQHRVSWKVLVAEIRTWMISFIKMHSFMQSSCWEKLIIFPQQEMTRRLFVLLR